MRRARDLMLESLDGKILLTMIATPIASMSPPIITPVSQGLVVKLSTDHQVYRRGQPVVITLSETNTSQHDITVESGPSLGGFFVAHNGRRVWASSTGIQPMFVFVRTLQPGESITQSATWNGQSNIGRFGRPTGHLVVASQVGGVQPVNIQIRQH